MSDMDIRKTGRAGRITLNRPKALNALTYEMCLAIEAALDGWRDDDDVALVVIDATGDKAFCAGGDIADLYARGKAGDYAFGQKFWADEYRLNHKMQVYPKPIVSLMQGFTMGGGVGVGCHGSHRIVGESSRIAMPECGIGLVPDVGGSLLLARAPGRLGEYLGLTATRMGPADAIHAGFADVFVAQDRWLALIEALETGGDPAAITEQAGTPPDGTLATLAPKLDPLFAAPDLAAIMSALEGAEDEAAQEALSAMRRNSPLSMACTIEIIRRLREDNATMAQALEQEYRFTARASEHGDFIEGIRAAIIDKDRAPNWQHAADNVPPEAVAAMLAPLPDSPLKLEE
jgi:enoyl-CoA hydratase